MPTPRPTTRRRASAPTVTGSMFYKHAACPHWLYFDANGDPKKKLRASKFAEMLMQMGLIHEEEALKGMDYREVKGRGNAARAKATLALMREGVERIYHGMLVADGMAGEPDILERRNDKSSSFGAYHYVAIDIKSAERLSDAHKYQLVFYGELLKAVQGTRPEDGIIMNGSGALLSFPLREFEQQFHKALGEIREAATGAIPEPYLSSGCKQSPWFKECIALAKSRDDVTLLYNVKKKVLAALREHGVRSVADAAALRVDDLLEASSVFTRATLERIKIQAQSLISGTHVVRRPIILPSGGTDIYFDIEGDPLRQVEYLFGFLLMRDGEERYEYQLAERPEDEERMWRDFLTWAEGIPEDATVYHYGTYEKARLTTLESKYGGSPALARFRAAMIDLNEIVKESVVFPLYFYGIKDIGRYIGFEREGKIAGGGESVAYYEEWLTKKSRKTLDAILAYNREDVVATRKLKEWLVEEGKKA